MAKPAQAVPGGRCVIEPHFAVARRGILYLEEEQSLAYGDLISRRQNPLPYGNSIHEGSRCTTEIGELKSALGSSDLTVPRRHGLVFDTDGTASIAAERKRWVETKFGFAEWPAYGLKSNAQ